MASETRCVLIYNPMSGHGHLDSWNAMFIALLLGRGWRVLALDKDIDDVRKRLDSLGCTQFDNLQLLPWQLRKPSFGFRLMAKLNRMALGLFLRLRQPFSLSRKQTAVLDVEQNYLDPIEFGLRIKSALTASVWCPDLVFNMYLDFYRTDRLRWTAFEKQLGIAWAGLCIDPKGGVIRDYMRLPHFKGLCLLDEAVKDSYQRLLPNKSFAYLPDITSGILPDAETEFVCEIKRRAGLRKIVFMGGSIGGNKNLAIWCELIARADSERWFFVQVGELHLSTLTESDVQARQNILANLPENLYLKESYLPDEAVFNQIIQASDIIFAVYREFQLSSNMLGKAALFKKPIIVAESYLMGERVSRYGIGATVGQEDVLAILSSLDQLVHTNPPQPDNFRAYQDDHSQDKLMTVFEAFIDHCLERDCASKSRQAT